MSRAPQRDGSPFPNVEQVALALSVAYGDPTLGNKTNPLRELLFIICSLQTNETLYQSTYASLMSRFPTFRQLADASEDEIADAIIRGGLARQKARTIRSILSRLESDFGMPTLSPLHAMSDIECEGYLESLPGIGRKTARCVLMYSLHRESCPGDSNCWRICRRLGWVRPTRPDKSCSPRDMDRVQAGVPPNIRLSLHVNLVSHGRDCCFPSRPSCEACCIRRFCRAGGKSRGEDCDSDTQLRGLPEQGSCGGLEEPRDHPPR
jgi:endonuclease III